MKMLNNKTYKQIPGFEGYYISSDGEIYSTKSSKFININYNTGTFPYPTVVLTMSDKNQCCMPVHKLVALAWCPIPSTYTFTEVLGNYLSHNLVVDHIDGDKLNFKASNLRWCTPEENVNFDNYDKNKRSKALMNNQNALGRKVADPHPRKYIYHYKDKDYSITELCKELNCSRSKITESFRRNLSLVKRGELTRSEYISDKNN